MKILIISQVFWPENFKINDLCSEFVKLGHEVTVITGKPNYPKGEFYPGFGLFSRITNYYNGAKVYRLPIIPRGNASGFRLSLNYLSFAFTGSLFSLAHCKKYDFSFVFGVSPLTAALPAIVHRWVYGTPHFLWVLDLWPEGVEVTGKLKSPVGKKMLHALVNFIYKKSDKIFIASRLMGKSILGKINSGQKKDISYLPNWAEDTFITDKVDLNKYSSLIPEGFILMFAGNIGSGQDCPSILKAAQLLQPQRNIKFVLLGDGSEKIFLEEQVKKSGLENTVFLLGSFPVEEMPHFYCHADAMLVTLKSNEIYSYMVPCKLQSYMASGKAVAAMINGEAAEIIKTSNCGAVVNAGDYQAFAEEVTRMSKLPVASLAELGQNGFAYYKKTFTRERIINSLLQSINS